MGIISKQYIKNLVGRYDKEVGVPYNKCSDFEGLHQEEYMFTNSKGIEIHYFYYYYDRYKDDKVILFCPGIGPGHTAYFAEINCLAKRGYKVLTLDYTGCGESKGEILGSLNMPTVDVVDLLDYLKLDKPVVLMGHSLGGYTSLNVLHLRDDIDTAVIISGFLSVPSMIKRWIPSKFLNTRVLKYEHKIVPQYFDINNIDYLKTTRNKLFFIQSEDDQMVPYDISLKVVEEIDNPSIQTLRMNGRKHNPNYTEDAVNYMNDVFGKYQTLIKNKSIKTDEDKINYFKNVSLRRLTQQDENLFDEIMKFIEE